jgi:hypothetical protein
MQQVHAKIQQLMVGKVVMMEITAMVMDVLLRAQLKQIIIESTWVQVLVQLDICAETEREKVMKPVTMEI